MANLARDIRSAGESNDLRDPYDLAGFNQQRLVQLVGTNNNLISLSLSRALSLPC